MIIAAEYGMIRIENCKAMEEVSNCLVYFSFVIAIMDIVAISIRIMKRKEF